MLEKESTINNTFKTNINKNIAEIESEIREQNEIINKIKLVILIWKLLKPS